MNFIYISLFLMVSCGLAIADMGPKPDMDFKIVYETSQQITIVDAKQMQCQDILCLKSAPLENAGPQGFGCGTSISQDGKTKNDSCGSLAYGYAPYQKLVITFSDKARESNIFKSKFFREKFQVIVKDNELVVTSISGEARPISKFNLFN
jgi:hypothetical protein